MDIDLELYRQEVRVSTDPLVRLSAIDLYPERARHTLVLLHGYGGQSLQWSYQLQEFAYRNRVIALDLRGHGRSDKPTSSYSMAEFLSDLETSLNLLEVGEQVVLVGHSYGGAIAAEFAANHPGRVARLVLIASSGEYRLNPIFRLLLKLPFSFHRIAQPFTRKWLGAPPTVMKRMYDNSVARWNGWELFEHISAPTLVIRGHSDRVFERAYFERVSQTIPLAEEINVGASGHMVMLERRQAVNRAIRQFIDQTPHSWREAESEAETAPDAELRHERPWLLHYQKGVPATVSIPQTPLHHLLRSAVRRFPLRSALVFEGYKITYRRLNQEVNRFANTLRSLGVNKGDRVMLLLPNMPQMVIAFYGLLKAGAVAVFTLPLNEPDEVLRQMRDSGAKALVTINQFGELAQQALNETQLEKVIFTSVVDYLPMIKRLGISLDRKSRNITRLKTKRREGVYQLHRILYTHSNKSPEVEVGPSDLAAIVYTGGTTQAPKGVMLSHYNLVANTIQTRHWMPEAQKGKERFLCVIPFSHSYGLTSALNVPISIGATLVLKAKFEVEDTLNTIKRHKPTIFPGVPQMYVAINNFPGVRKYNVASIQACISGSEPLAVEVQEAFEKLTKGRLVEGYGLTEASPVTHANPLHGLRKVGSIGIPLPSTEARVAFLTDASKTCQTGEIGELAVRGPQVMLGYWGDEETTQKTITADGWLLTGDVAQMDDQGYFRLIARKADMWYPGKPGEPAFPRDVEEVLYEVPQVKEAAVIAIAGQPIAFVIAKNEKQKPSAKKLMAYCQRRLPPELVPRLVIFVEDFPRSFVGKVIRRELAKYYEKHHAE